MSLGLSIFRQPLTLQPWAPVPIDWSNPITSGLVFSALNSAQDYALGARNYVTGVQGSLVQGMQSVATPYPDRGRAALFDGSSSATVTQNANLSGLKAFSVGYWLWWDSYGGATNKPALNYQSASIDAGTWFILHTDPTNVAVSFWMYSGPSNNELATIPRPSAAAWHYFLWCLDLNQGAPVRAAYVDGVSQGIGVSTTFGTTTLPLKPFSFMCGPPSGPTNFSAGRLANVNIWNRMLSAGEGYSMYLNSLQILQSDLVLVGIPGSGPPAGQAKWFLQH